MLKKTAILENLIGKGHVTLKQEKTKLSSWFRDEALGYVVTTIKLRTNLK